MKATKVDTWELQLTIGKEEATRATTDATYAQSIFAAALGNVNGKAVYQKKTPHQSTVQQLARTYPCALCGKLVSPTKMAIVTHIGRKHKGEITTQDYLARFGEPK